MKLEHLGPRERLAVGPVYRAQRLCIAEHHEPTHDVRRP